jgi:hypothetical protein
MALMYSWATPERLLDYMTLEQVLLYFSKGWDGEQERAIILWGVFGMALQGLDPRDKSDVKGLKEFKKAHPDGNNDGGAWRVTR